MIDGIISGTFLQCSIHQLISDSLIMGNSYFPNKWITMHKYGITMDIYHLSLVMICDYHMG